MKVIMNQKELDMHLEYIDTRPDDCMVHRDEKSASGYAVYVRMNHWDIYIPIFMEE